MCPKIINDMSIVNFYTQATELLIVNFAWLLNEIWIYSFNIEPTLSTMAMTCDTLSTFEKIRFPRNVQII